MINNSSGRIFVDHRIDILEFMLRNGHRKNAISKGAGISRWNLIYYEDNGLSELELDQLEAYFLEYSKHLVGLLGALKH